MLINIFKNKKALFILSILITSFSLILTSCVPTTPADEGQAQNGVTYRFLCVGVGEYINYGSEIDFGDAPPYELIYQVLSKWKFGPEKIGFSRIDYISDFEATKNNILQGIASTFSEADDDDVLYFYFGGHGDKDESIYYICPADMTSSVSSMISVNELEEALVPYMGRR